MQDIILTQFSKTELVNEIVDRLTTVIELREKKSLHQKEYLTRKEVSELLKISITTVHDWTHNRGILKSRKIGNRVLYLYSDVLEAMEAIESRKSNRR
jgi:excisionase family DNA binding protein